MYIRTGIIFLVPAAIYICVFTETVEARKCPSYCTNHSLACVSKGGRIVGYCTNNLACCDLTVKYRVSCGEKRGNTSAVWEFRSPRYPAWHSNDLLCPFTFEFQDDTVGIMLEFLEFTSDGIKFGPQAASCDTDMLFIRGFGSWTPPPFCGHLTGYKVVIDDSKLDGVNEMMLLGVMSSRAYRWKIKITQIHEEDFKYERDEEAEKELTSNSKPREVFDPDHSPRQFNKDAYGILHSSKRRNRRLRTSENYYPRKGSQDYYKTIEGFTNHALLNPQVVNGVNTAPGKVPWQASLRMDFLRMKISGDHGSSQLQGCDVAEGFHRCGGSIIGDREILTAAHCFSAHTKLGEIPLLDEHVVVLGDNNKCADEAASTDAKQNASSMLQYKFRNPAVQVYAIESVTLHYAYEPSVIFNDLALIRLRKNINFTDNIKSIVLADEGGDYTGHSAFVSGWGRTDIRDEKNTGSKVLQSSDNLIIDKSNFCKRHTLHYMRTPEEMLTLTDKYKDITHSTICLKTKNHTVDVLVGEGDSGGPLVIWNDTTPVLVGVVSFANPVKRRTDIKSAGDFVDYYQSVAHYRNWIDTALCAVNLRKH